MQNYAGRVGVVVGGPSDVCIKVSKIPRVTL